MNSSEYLLADLDPRTSLPSLCATAPQEKSSSASRQSDMPQALIFKPGRITRIRKRVAKYIPEWTAA